MIINSTFLKIRFFSRKNKSVSIVLFITIGLLFTSNVKSQYAMFLTQGNISFEKRVNSVAILKERIGDNQDDWDTQILNAYKKSGQTFKSTYFNLAFKDDKTLYEPDKNVQIANTAISDFTDVAGSNIVFSDFDKQEYVASKSVAGDNFLISDSVRKIKWKITDELRDIAGFQCRRANAVIMDSIYVVAFYTTEILTSGGPESFNGLPGMILELALPHEHITWVASKVSVNPPVTDNMLTPPKKGKAVSGSGFKDVLSKSLKDWGKSGAIMIKNASY